MHPVPEQHLGAVDVADARQHRLVHQQAADRRPAAADALPGARRVGVGAERVGADPGDDGVALGGGDQRAGGGPAQVGPRGAAVAVGHQPQPDLADRRRDLAVGRRAGRVDVEAAVEPEVDVDVPLARERDEEVLAPRLGTEQHLAVELGRLGREPPLRAADGDAASAEDGR